MRGGDLSTDDVVSRLPDPTEEVRLRLAAAQRALLAALVEGGPAPEGHDAQRLRVQAAALAAKRALPAHRHAPVTSWRSGRRWRVGR